MNPNENVLRQHSIRRRALIGGAVVFSMLAASSKADNTTPAASGNAPEVLTMADVPLSSNAKITVERRGQIVLIGINRTYINNRLDPEAFVALSKAYYQYDHDPSLRAAVLFGYGDSFSRGVDVDAYQKLAAAGKPLIPDGKTIDPLGVEGAKRTKPVVIVVHGDTWNAAHELFLASDIRVAAADTEFAQDESSHARYPGGGGTIRFVHEAGWGNAMRYMLTGDHWTAEDALRMGTLQAIAPTAEKALELGIKFANAIAAAGPLGIQATLRTARLALEPAQAEAYSSLYAQYQALYRTDDFSEGRKAEAEKRLPVYNGR